jgi:hypothetical protein
VISKYNEYIKKFPNNSQISDDYSDFLVECATDFSTSLRQKYRANLIDEGKIFVIDLSFRSLMRNFPWYLKKKIIDFNGRFIHPEFKNTPQSLISDQSLTCFSIDLDNEQEDLLGKTQFSRHRSRLASRKAFAQLKLFLLEYFFQISLQVE